MSEPDELERLAGLPPDDPRVLAAPARVRARLRMLRDFEFPGDAPEGARVDEAERVLGTALESEWGVTTSVTPEACHPPRRAASGSALKRRWWSGGGSPALRLGFAALAVLVGIGWVAGSLTRAPRERVMRGGPDALGAGELTAASHPLPDGSLRLEWQAAAQARSYTIVFLSPALEEQRRVEGLRETHFDLRPGALPAGLGSGQRLLWRVSAMRGTDEIGHSIARAIAVP